MPADMKSVKRHRLPTGASDAFCACLIGASVGRSPSRSCCRRNSLTAKCGVGLSLNPATPFEAVEAHLPAIDLLLVMTVHPGFGGQPFRPEMMDKVKRAKAWRDSHGAKLHIEVDGGINPETASVSIANGANILVAGTSIFRAQDYAKAIRDLRGDSLTE